MNIIDALMANGLDYTMAGAVAAPLWILLPVLALMGLFYLIFGSMK